MTLPPIGPLVISPALWAVPFTILRREYGSRSNGVYTPGQLTSTSALGNFKVPRGDQLFEIPEGERKGEWLRVSTLTELRTAEEPNKHEADVILYYGVYYKVVACRRSRSAAYYLATCSRLSDVEFLSIILASGSVSAQLTASGVLSGISGVSGSAAAQATLTGNASRVLFGSGSVSAQGVATGSATDVFAVPDPVDYFPFGYAAVYGAGTGERIFGTYNGALPVGADSTAIRVGTYNGSSAETTGSVSGVARQFTGNSGYVRQTGGLVALSTASQSVFAHVKYPVGTQSPSFYPIGTYVNAEASGTPGYGFYWYFVPSSSSLAIGINTVGIEVEFTWTVGDLRDNLWHDVGIVWNRVTQNVSGYLDGTPLGSQSVTGQNGSIPADQTQTDVNAFRAGFIPNSTIDEYMRWQGVALTPANMAYLHSLRLAGTPFGVVRGFLP